MYQNVKFLKEWKAKRNNKFEERRSKINDPLDSSIESIRNRVTCHSMEEAVRRLRSDEDIS